MERIGLHLCDASEKSTHSNSHSHSHRRTYIRMENVQMRTVFIVRFLLRNRIIFRFLFLLWLFFIIGNMHCERMRKKSYYDMYVIKISTFLMRAEICLRVFEFVVVGVGVVCECSSTQFQLYIVFFFRVIISIFFFRLMFTHWTMQEKRAFWHA